MVPSGGGARPSASVFPPPPALAPLLEHAFVRRSTPTDVEMPWRVVPEAHASIVVAVAEPRATADRRAHGGGAACVERCDRVLPRPGHSTRSPLETLFHEASHTIVDESAGTVGEGIAAAARAHHVPVPDGLWHAVMFYTLGEYLRRDLAKLGVAYDPESGMCDLYRGPWVLYRDAAALFWRPHMLGALPLDSALDRMVGAVSVDPAH